MQNSYEFPTANVYVEALPQRFDIPLEKLSNENGEFEKILLTDVQDSIQVEVLVAALTIDSCHMVIDSERVSFWCRPSDAHCVPFAVVQPRPGSVPDPDWAVTQVEHVMNVSVDQLHGDEVAFSTGVVEN